MELDVDPEEFEVIEPVWLRPGGIEKVPVIQFTDRLINGAGFCKRLSEDDGQGSPMIDSIIGAMLTGPTSVYPLDQLLADRHPDTCDQACYRCLMRYRNQPFHGLLDWQLGLTFLEVLGTPNFTCGLDGNFDSSRGLSKWTFWCESYARKMARLYGGQAHQFAGLWSFTAPAGRINAPVLIVHPLWDRDNAVGIHAQALEEATDVLGMPPPRADTFNLARRPSWVIERLLRGEEA
jgi:hypothetical protein